jgi:Domain of unknown function (DUF3806)
MKCMALLCDEDRAYLQSHIDWVDGWIKDDRQLKFQSHEGRLKLIQQIIDTSTLSPSETIKLQALGNYFGVAVCEYTGWKFAVIEDEYGRGISIQVPGNDTWVHPTTMISKRIEDGESVNVFDLFVRVVARARELSGNGVD